MKYNFDEIIDRQHTNALNTDGFRGYIFHAGPEKKFNYADDEFVRMWVADMEFGVAPEILDAIRRTPGARSLDGVKRRTRAGMGRCQSGFCSPRVMEILARELGKPIESITKSGGASHIIVGIDKDSL